MGDARNLIEKQYNRYLENKMKLFIFAILLTISLAEKNDWPCPSEDVNFSGHDVERVDGVDSWSECGQICNVYPNCKYWTYEPSGPHGHGCWMKSSDNGMERKNGYISGEKSCS